MTPNDRYHNDKQFAGPSVRAVISIALIITAVIGIQLFRTAVATGNYEGMLFSIAHTVIVAVATVLALRQ